MTTDILDRLALRLSRVREGEVHTCSDHCTDNACLAHGSLREIRRLRDIISPSAAAEYEEGMAALRERLAEAERDAARYRWLRDRAWPFEFNGDTPADADAAIDAAMRPPAKNHTPRCSYWDGLFAQVCNCGAADNERA